MSEYNGTSHWLPAIQHDDVAKQMLKWLLLMWPDVTPMMKKGVYSRVSETLSGKQYISSMSLWCVMLLVIWLSFDVDNVMTDIYWHKILDEFTWKFRFWILYVISVRTIHIYHKGMVWGCSNIAIGNRGWTETAMINLHIGFVNPGPTYCSVKLHTTPLVIEGASHRWLHYIDNTSTREIGY